MIAQNELSGWRLWLVQRLWMGARWPAVVLAWLCWKLNAHKEIVNWLLMPWAWTTVLFTGTDWSNFYALRTHHAARQEMRRLALMALQAQEASVPRKLAAGDWHLPYVTDEERRTLTIMQQCRVSAARCARLSLLKQDDTRTLTADLGKAAELEFNGHMSPFEHQAKALAVNVRVANYQAFASYRSTIPFEHDFALIVAARKKEGRNV
jgi:thymidylate synthase ThyX